MTDTSAMNRAETWIREEELPRLFGQPFSQRRVTHSYGGIFIPDAVSEDGKIAVCVSTSTARTGRGNFGVAKHNKILKDCYFLEKLPVERRILIFTERSMYESVLSYRDVLRHIGPEIEILHVQLPPALATEVSAVRAKASRETGG